jgi:hypothetical protein
MNALVKIVAAAWVDDEPFPGVVQVQLLDRFD